MKTYIYILCIALLFSCKKDKVVVSPQAVEIVDSLVSDIIPLESISSNEHILEKNEKVAGTNIIVKQTKINIDSIREIIENKIDTSINNGKTCEQMMKEYEKLFRKLLSNKSDKETANELSKWTKDILHAHCLKTNPEYLKKKEELDEMIDE
jgi:alcohol dehydrogenase class IV